MEISEPLVITRHRVARLVNGNEDLLAKYFRGSHAALVLPWKLRVSRTRAALETGPIV